MVRKKTIILILFSLICLSTLAMATMDVSDDRILGIDSTTGETFTLTNFNLSIGNGELLVGSVSAEPGILVRKWHSTDGTNGHGIVDQSLVDSTGSYASFDAYAYINGTEARDHYNGYQMRSYHTAGTLNTFRGYYSYPFISGGTITNLYHFNVGDTQHTGGTITNEYGLYMEDVDNGSALNYAIYTNAGQIRFGDNVIIANSDLTVAGDALYVDGTNDRVGIGTASLDRTLNVDGQASNTNIHIYNDASGGTTGDGFDIVFTGADTQLRNRESGNVDIFTSNTERVTIDSNGDVGINNDNPTAKLQIQQSDSARALDINMDGNQVGVHIQVNDTSARTQTGFILRDDSSTEYVHLLRNNDTTGSNLIYRNQDSNITNGAVLKIDQDHANDNQEALQIKQDASAEHITFVGNGGSCTAGTYGLYANVSGDGELYYCQNGVAEQISP